MKLTQYGAAIQDRLEEMVRTGKTDMEEAEALLV